MKDLMMVTVKYDFLGTMTAIEVTLEAMELFLFLYQDIPKYIGIISAAGSASSL